MNSNRYNHLGSRKRNILVISNVPTLTKIGGGIRTIQIIKILREIGFDVSLYIVYPQKWGKLALEWIEFMKENYDYKGVFYFNKNYSLIPEVKLYKEIKMKSKLFEYVLFRFDATAFLSAFYFLSFKKKIIIDLDDYNITSLNFYDKLKEKFKRLIINIFSDHNFVLEKKYMKLFKKSSYIPNLPLNSFYYSHYNFKKNRSLNPSLLFVGNKPEWLILFLQSQWKFIKAKIENIELFIVSQNKNIEKYLQFFSGINIYNDIDNIQPFYEKSWISIIPSQHKYGTLIKIIESIYYKTPVVCSTSVLRGYEIFNKKEDLILNSVDNDELANIIVDLLSSEKKIDYIAEQAYLIALREFSISTIIDSLKNIFL